MPRKPGESYENYQQRIMDPISSSFCAAKWKNATIILNQGLTKSCHHPVAHKIGRWEIFWDASALHNTRNKKKQRQMMLNGERPKGCEYCWLVEDLQQKVISDRVYKTEIYDDEEIQKITKTPVNKPVNPETLELSFARTCNFACSYCNADYSSTWAKDIHKNGNYRRLVTRDSLPYIKAGWLPQYEADENPYIKAFWKWFPSLSKDLKQLRITGGEPLMSKDVWHLFDKLALPENHHIKFAINSNLGANPNLIEKLIQKSHEVPHLEVYTSNEATGEHAEYIRDGLNYDIWRQNCLNLLERGHIRQLHVMMTVNSLCLFTLTDLLDEILKWRERFQRPVGIWTLNILRYPAFMSILVLPDSIKKERTEHFIQWLIKNKTHPLILDMEIANLERLISCLQDGKKPHPKAQNLNKQWMDFKTFFMQYDERRKKNFEKTFEGPLSDWYQALKANPILFPIEKPAILRNWI
ncbi:MAG: radical SAM protein [Bdellovibrionales bacterium]|nr:radical SAM protein [Bdellovibrionales bacterium]